LEASERLVMVFSWPSWQGREPESPRPGNSSAAMPPTGAELVVVAASVTYGALPTSWQNSALPTTEVVVET